MLPYILWLIYLAGAAINSPVAASRYRTAGW